MRTLPLASLPFLITIMLPACSPDSKSNLRTESIKPVIQPSDKDTFSFESIGISDDSLKALFVSSGDGLESTIVEKFAGSMVNLDGECQHVLFVIAKISQGEMEEFVLYNLNYSLENGEHTIALSTEDSFPVGFQAEKRMTISQEFTLRDDGCGVLTLTDETNFGDAMGSSTMKHLYALNESGILQEILQYGEQFIYPPDDSDASTTYTFNYIHPSAAGDSGFKNVVLTQITTRDDDTVSVQKKPFQFSKGQEKYVTTSY